MSFYSLNKDQRAKKVAKIKSEILSDLNENSIVRITKYFSNEDTYIRKVGYLSIGKIYHEYPGLQSKILKTVTRIYKHKDPKVRQTSINAAGEIGIHNFEVVEHFFDGGLFDEHHSVRNAVIGSVKKMGQKNPKPVLSWAKKYLHHADKEVRREICHGIELRGRTHPQDILPLLKELQNDPTARVRNTLIHVLGQISYKKGCLEMVIEEINHWENKELTHKAVSEILDVHERYKNFAARTQQEALSYITKHFEFYAL